MDVPVIQYSIVVVSPKISTANDHLMVSVVNLQSQESPFFRTETNRECRNRFVWEKHGFYLFIYNLFFSFSIFFFPKIQSENKNKNKNNAESHHEQNERDRTNDISACDI